MLRCVGAKIYHSFSALLLEEVLLLFLIVGCPHVQFKLLGKSTCCPFRFPGQQAQTTTVCSVVSVDQMTTLSRNITTTTITITIIVSLISARWEGRACPEDVLCRLVVETAG
jgi:hypothetical protein